MRAWQCLPSWLLTRAILPFVPKTHPWRGLRPTLRQWNESQTDLCRAFDFVLWLNAAVTLFFVVQIWRNI